MPPFQSQNKPFLTTIGQSVDRRPSRRFLHDFRPRQVLFQNVGANPCVRPEVGRHTGLPLPQVIEKMPRQLPKWPESPFSLILTGKFVPNCLDLLFP